MPSPLKISFTAHRPQDLWGSFDWFEEIECQDCKPMWFTQPHNCPVCNNTRVIQVMHPKLEKLKAVLSEVLEYLIAVGIDGRKANLFRSGGALGGDTVAFMCVDLLKQRYPDITNIVDIPFKNQHVKWNKKFDLDNYANMLGSADAIVCVDAVEGYMIQSLMDNGIRIGSYHPAKMQKRNEYMVDHTDVLIALWDKDIVNKSGTYNCIKYARKIGKPIIIIDPSEDFMITCERGLW